MLLLLVMLLVMLLLWLRLMGGRVTLALLLSGGSGGLVVRLSVWRSVVVLACGVILSMANEVCEGAWVRTGGIITRIA